MNKNKIQICLLSILLLFCLNTPALAQTHVGSTYSGSEAQIKQFLCTPSDASTSKDKASNDLYNCINRIYRFALVTASFFAVFMIVLAAYGLPSDVPWLLGFKRLVHMRESVWGMLQYSSPGTKPKPLSFYTTYIKRHAAAALRSTRPDSKIP